MSIVEEGMLMAAKTNELLEELDVACADITDESQQIFAQQRALVFEKLAELQCKFLLFVETEVSIDSSGPGLSLFDDPFLLSLTDRCWLYSTRRVSTPPQHISTVLKRWCARRWAGWWMAWRRCSARFRRLCGTSNGKCVADVDLSRLPVMPVAGNSWSYRMC
jgi:hypothetical protein